MKTIICIIIALFLISGASAIHPQVVKNPKTPDMLPPCGNGAPKGCCIDENAQIKCDGK